MASSTSSGPLSGNAANGFDHPLPRIRGRLETTLHRLRTTVLPDPDTLPAVPHDLTTGHARSHRERRPHVLVLRKLVPASVAVLLLLVIGLVVFRGVYDNRVYPAVVVGDVHVGGLTTTEAHERLAERAADLERGTISFSYQGQTWMPALSELGATVMLNESVADAHQLGRDGDAVARLAFIGDILDADQMVPLQTRIDQGALNAWFNAVDRGIDRPPINADIVIEETTVTVAPGKTGVVVNREAATDHIVRALSSLQPVVVELPTRIADPDITADELVPVQEQVAQVLNEPVSATFDDDRWTIKAATVSPYLHPEIVTESGVPTARLTIDTDGLAGELRGLFTHEINREPVNAVLGWDDGLTVVEPGITGATLKADAFASAVSHSFLNGHTPVEIPVVSIAPEINGANLDTYGITTLLGSGHSNFEGGTWERDENVRVGTAFVNSTLVPPGGTFSFNQTVGEITYEKGYQDALVVSAERVGRDVGGGICQVSTTIFRAAINAGMPIVEWYPHTYRLPNYERDGWGPGFDASILQSGPDPEQWADFKFENYTNHWLLIEARVADAHVYIDIYGTGDGRSVVVKNWQIGRNAFGFAQIIHDARGQVIAEETFESHYK